MRPLLLNGFMATGKSSVARRVAELSGHPLIDLDARIEERAGRRISEIFAEQGETGFRALERAELDAVLERADTAPVIALGAGALVRRDLRLRALDQGVVVSLEASVPELLRRAGRTGTRPLLAEADPEARARELLELRSATYAESHARITTDGMSVDAVAAAALAVWRQDPIAVAAAERSYAVDIGAGIVEARLPGAIGAPSRLVLVSDETVHALHGARVERALEAAQSSVILPPGEQHKHVGSVERIWRHALAAGADRRSIFLALGGGVVSDVAGFAAATYMRGVGWVGVPTTLLAMVDASVGGKTGVDLEAAKNAVGSFHQPRAVLCDVDFLATETPRAFQSALAEVVKTALIADAALLELLEAQAPRLAERPRDLLVELVRRSIRVKARIVSEDEREGGLRAVLNLGHTVGHALEAQGGYARLTHGEAISLGLVAALRIGVRLGTTPAELEQRVAALLARLGLPVDLREQPLADAVALIGHDKKRAGSRLRFVVARAPGSVDLVDLALSELETSVRALI